MAQSHENLGRAHEVTVPSERSFGLVFTVVLGLVGAWPVLQGETPRWWSLVLALVILAIALLRPDWLARPNRWWMQFGILLGKVVSTLALGILYYFTIVPIGVLMRIAGKDPLRLRFDPKPNTYWIRREPPSPEPDSLTRQF